MSEPSTFEDFVGLAVPRLHRALIGSVGVDRVDDAVGEAIAWAFEHQSELARMDNPVGYLYRVGRSRVRERKRPRLFRSDTTRIPDVEPGLADALAGLPESQRTAVWLAHGCGWTHAEIGAATGVTESTVSTHVQRAIHRLRHELVL